MDKYISSKAVLDILADELRFSNAIDEIVILRISRRVKQIPAADVRPVVLCKDCVHFQQFRPHAGLCKIDGMLWDNDFFCAKGKKEKS